MADERRIIGYDVDGYDVITSAVMDLLNNYPGLEENDEIRFSVLDLSSGKAMFPSAGAVITMERISITDHVVQECQYPFSVVYRAAALSESRRTSVKDWLDKLGRWLEKQVIRIGDTDYKIDEYPKLDSGREFRRFSRSSPAYLYTVQSNQSEDWTIQITAYYHNEFDR
ncbi:MAG: hypothetical protein IJM76_05950 [Lachnospiraceae bacterium]|nr:hypothetical protein [Lachnospiraceae bacterium]